jgi:hypothetical protein
MQSLLIRLLLAIFLTPSLVLAQLYEIKRGSKWGLIDGSGKTVLPLAYDYVYADQERNYFFTRKGRKTGLYHPQNQVRIEPKYDLIFAPDSKTGYFFQIVEKGKYGLLDSTGSLLIKPEYDEIKFFGKDYYTFRKDKYWGMGSRLSSAHIPAKYQRIIPFKNKKETFFMGTSFKGISSIWNAQGDEIAYNLKYEVVKLVGESFVYKNNSRYGLLSKNGTELTPAIYKQIYPTGKHIGVAIDEAYGVFSSRGQEILLTQYSKLRADSSGSVWFQDSLHWGVINAEGSILFQPQFKKSSNFLGPVASVRQDSGYGVINYLGEFLVPAIYDEIKLYAGMVRGRKGNQWTQVLFDESGQKLKKRKLIITKNRRQYEYAAYRALIQNDDVEKAGWFKAEGRWGLRDTVLGSTLIKPVYGSVEVISGQGLTVVTDRPKGSRRKYGLVNHLTGKVLVEPTFREIYHHDFKEADACRVSDGDKLMLLSRQGKTRKIPNATHICSPHRGIFRVMNGEIRLNQNMDAVTEVELRNNYYNWKLVNELGNTIGQPIYNYIGPFYRGVATARKSEEKKEVWVLIDTLHQEVSDPIPLAIIDPGNNSPFLISQKDTFTYHFLDLEGNFLFSRDQFWMNPDSQFKMVDVIENFSDGMAKVKIQNKWGFMNAKGEIIVPPIYNKTNDFHEGLAAVRLKKDWGYLNKQGMMAIKPKYRQATDFSDGRAAVRGASGWGFIDQRGKKSPQTKDAETLPYQDNLGPAKNRYWGLVNQKGKWVVKPIYGQIEKNGRILESKTKWHVWLPG